MKTTPDLSEVLVRGMKVRAAREGRKLREVATEIFQRGLSAPEPKAASKARRVKLPLFEGGTANRQFTPKELDEILLQQEVEWHHEAAGR